MQDGVKTSGWGCLRYSIHTVKPCHDCCYVRRPPVHHSLRLTTLFAKNTHTHTTQQKQQQKLQLTNKQKYKQTHTNKIKQTNKQTNKTSTTSTTNKQTIHKCYYCSDLNSIIEYI